MSQVVREADLVIVGRIAGLVDPKPEAANRRRLEAHWIQVERTLKGVDETGQRLRARPNGAKWLDGQSYIIFLRRLGLDGFEPLSQELVEATETNVGALVKEIARQGGSVHLRRAVWMRHEGGWGAGLLAEFFVTADGQFEWRRRLSSGSSKGGEYEGRAGRLPQDALASLLHDVEEAGPGPSADDAGIVTFRWLDALGKAQSKTYFLPDQPPCTELLATIRGLAQRYAKQRL